LRLSPDQSLLHVSDGMNKWVWSLRIQTDGAPEQGEPFYRLETADEFSAMDAGRMAVDSLGFLYIATNVGVQVCDEQGRVALIINLPAYGFPDGITFGGPDFQDLFIAVHGQLFKRHMLRKGFPPWVQQKPARQP